MAQFEITQSTDGYSFVLLGDDGTQLATGPTFANAELARAGIDAVRQAVADAAEPFPGEDDEPNETLGITRH